MNLLRLIALLVIIWLAYRWVRAMFPKEPAARTEEASSPVRVIRCARCGLHVPEDKAVQEAGIWYCTPEHRDGSE